MLENLFGQRVFGAKVAIGIMASAILLAIAHQGFVVGQWVVTHH